MDFSSALNFSSSAFLPQKEFVQVKTMPLSEFLSLVIQQKKHFAVHKGFINEIKQDPNSGLTEAQDIHFCAAYGTIKEIMGSRAFMRELSNITDTNPSLNLLQDRMLTMFFDLCKPSSKNLLSFIHDKDIFLGLLLKDNAQQHLFQIGTLCRQDPSYAISLAYFSLQKFEKYPGFQRTLNSRLDTWLAQQLETVNFKKANTNLDFHKLILGYLANSSSEDSAAAHVIFKNCDTFSPEIQNHLWRALNQNSSFDKKRTIIHGFMETDHNAETNRIFHTYFSSALSLQQQADILGVASDSQQQHFSRIVKSLHLPITHIQIKKPNLSKHTFLIWHLLEADKIPQSEVLEFIQNAPLPDKKTPASTSFLFQDKESFYPDLFVAGCNRMKDSPFLLLTWIASFRKCPEAKSWLATKWLDLPLSMRQNKNMILSLDNHFDLIYQTALRGDTGILNEIKNHLDTRDLKLRLIRPHKNKETALHTLCRQSQKGLVKLLDVFTPEERQELSKITNALGQTPIDCCSSDFYRFLTQGSFVRPTQPKEKKSEPKPQPIESIQFTAPKVEPVWRPVVRMVQFEKNLEEFSLIPQVIEAAQQEIKALRSMPATELHLRIRQDIKPGIKNKPCVADFSVGGTAYRMGYVVKKGVLAPFFLMSHENYNNELRNRRYMPFLTKLARRQAEEYQQQKS